MVTAFVMTSVDGGRIPETAERIAALDGVSEVYSVTGEYDLVVVVRVRDSQDLAALIPERIAKTPGVVATTTQIAFQAYSRFDLNQAFDLGLD